MREQTKDYLRVFYLVFLPMVLVLALILDRWWAWLSLIAFGVWLVRKFLDYDELSEEGSPD